MLARVVAGAVAAALVALAAWRAGSLSGSGAIAAAIVGTLAVAAGWRWGALLIAYFVVSVSLSRVGAAAKLARTGSVVEKAGRRDAAQVLANGGAFALLAILAALASAASVVGLALAAAAIGALASAAADTWATEIGTLSAATPRSLAGWRAVPAGTSGAITIPGTLALVAGAAFVAALARSMHLTPLTLAVLVAGVVGALADSVLGATLQQRRWCAVCARATERRVHDCGARTTIAGGLAWLDNDAVNAAATIVGATTAAVLATLRA